VRHAPVNVCDFTGLSSLWITLEILWITFSNWGKLAYLFHLSVDYLLEKFPLYPNIFSFYFFNP